MTSSSLHLRSALAVLTVALLAASATAARAQQAGMWQLVYAVDSAGRTIEGDKRALIERVRAGQPIRVGWRIPWRTSDASGVIEHAADAGFLTVHRDEVFAQLAPILGQSPSAREPSIALRTEQDRLWYALLDTTGRLVSYFTGSANTTTIRLATYWYATGTTGPR